jgi:hypothetical protein
MVELASLFISDLEWISYTLCDLALKSLDVSYCGTCSVAFAAVQFVSAHRTKKNTNKHTNNKTTLHTKTLKKNNTNNKTNMSTMRTVLTFAVSLRGSIVDHTFKNKQYQTTIIQNK